MEAFNVLPDPQTNGGLLIALEETAAEEVKQLFKAEGYHEFVEPIGRFITNS